MSSFNPEEREAIRLVFDSILGEMQAERDAAEGKPAPPTTPSPSAWKAAATPCSSTWRAASGS